MMKITIETVYERSGQRSGWIGKYKIGEDGVTSTIPGLHASEEDATKKAMKAVMAIVSGR